MTPEQDVQARTNALGVKIVRMMNVLAEGEDANIACGALLSATATLLTSWARPGQQGPLLVSASDFFLQAAERYPVGVPMPGFFTLDGSTSPLAGGGASK